MFLETSSGVEAPQVAALGSWTNLRRRNLAVQTRNWVYKRADPDAQNGNPGSMMGRPTMTRVIGTFWALLGAFLTFKVYA
jgi:hypothetical protein